MKSSFVSVTVFVRAGKKVRRIVKLVHKSSSLYAGYYLDIAATRFGSEFGAGSVSAFTAGGVRFPVRAELI